MDTDLPASGCYAFLGRDLVPTHRVFWACWPYRPGVTVYSV
jgi:hypothetical protein